MEHQSSIFDVKKLKSLDSLKAYYSLLVINSDIKSMSKEEREDYQTRLMQLEEEIRLRTSSTATDLEPIGEMSSSSAIHTATPHTQQYNNFHTANSTPTINDDNFSKPSKKHTAQKPVNKSPTPITTSNRFANLETMDTSNSNTQENSQPRARDSHSSGPTLKIKTAENPIEFIKKLNRGLGFTVTGKLLSKYIQIHTTSYDQFSNISEYLTSLNIEFFVSLPKCDRPRKVVLRGIPSGTSPDEIIHELALLGFQPIRANVMTKLVDKIKQPMPLFLVQLKNTENFDKIFKIDSLLNLKIKVQPYSSKRPPQCRKCLGFGHHSDNCFISAKCLKCAQNHLTINCTSTLNKLICAHCGKDHPANYRGCEFFPKPKPKSIPIFNSYSYAKIVQNNNNSKSDNPNFSISSKSVNSDNKTFTTFNTALQDFNDLIIILNEIKPLLSKLKSALPRIKSAPDSLSKLLILMEVCN